MFPLTPTGFSAPFVGMTLGGTGGDRYELQSPLGQGSFGTTWRALDRDEDAIVAVKLLNPSTTPDSVLREARLQRRLSAHSRIVSIRNVELGANPSSFIVLDLINGGSLQDVVESRRPTVLESHRWICDTLEALDHAHEENVLHRDIKPSNLLLGPEGHALLTDFGVAEDSIRRAVPSPGMYPLTLPPEFGSGPTTVQTDLWLVGVLGWQLLVGDRPGLTDAYAGSLLSPHRFSPEIPIALSRAVMAALAPDPAGRPASAGRMLEEVSRVPVHCGWHDLNATDPAVVRSWRADSAGGSITVEIRRRPRGGYLVTATAPAGRRLRKRRYSDEPSEAKALQRARAWLTEVVGGNSL